MKATKLLKLLAVATLSLGSICPATAAPDNDALRAVYNNKKSSVYGLKGILKINITFNGQTQEQEAKIWANATAISDNLLVAAYSALSPNIANKRPGIEFTKELEALKLVNAAGEEFDAKLVLHDEDLGLAFIAVDPKGENAANWKTQAVDISKDITLQHLDKTINISRHNTNFRYQSGVSIGIVSVILDKPRKLYLIRGASMSAPTFTTNGDFVGITVSKKSGAKMQPIPVTIPAKYIRFLMPQAQEKAAALKK